MRSLFFIIILFSLGITRGLSQLNPELFSQYSELEGTIIYDVLPDRSGNIWIATQGGLVMFDGYEYKRFHPNPDDPRTIASILTYCLHKDKDGRIWIGSLSNIYAYDPSTRLFKTYHFHPLTDFAENTQPVISAISEGRDGRVYFGINSNLGFTGYKTLVYYNPETDSIHPFEFPENIQPENIANSTSDSFGNIWFIAYNGLFKIGIDNAITQIRLPEGIKHQSDDYLTGILADDNGTLWLTSSTSNLYAYDTGQDTFDLWNIEYNENAEVLTDFFVDLVFDSDSNVMIGTRRGLIQFDPDEARFNGLKVNPGKSYINAWITGIHYDSFGNLWMGTSSKGLIKYNERQLFHSAVHREGVINSITTGWVDNILEFEDNRIWFGTTGGSGQAGLNEIDLSNGYVKSYPFDQILGEFNYARVIGKVDTDKIILSFNGQYNYFNVQTYRIEQGNLPWSPDSVYIFRTHTDKNGDTWCATFAGAYRIGYKDREVIHYNHFISDGDTIEIGEVSDVFESDHYGMWLLGNNGLFLVSKETGLVERHAYDPAKGDVLSIQDINSFYEDINGVVWVGTWEGGLNRYSPTAGEVKVYDINTGLPSMSIQGILPDMDNNSLWLSTFQGISRFDTQSEEFNNFSLDDGIQGLLFANGSILKTSDEYLIFGGNNGITYFHPDNFSVKSDPPIVNITDFKIGNSSLLEVAGSDIVDLNELELTHSQNNISISYNGIHYDNPDKNAFRYMLENYDDHWREVGNMRSAFYYNLPPGQYSFRLMASNSNGVWTKDEVKLSFSILPPWWKTWWAYGAYILITIIAFILIDRTQRKRIFEKERRASREKELAQAKEIEKAYHKLKKTQDQLIHSEKMASLGELTAGIAHEIQNPLNFVNNFSEVNTELLGELNEEIRKGDLDEASALISDITGNEEKISYHGKRADDIVKGMLSHSRGSNEKKEPTDINALADEYLRLSFHGLRAKDKSFNADFKLDADESLPEIKVIPQEIGRVFLNLINNAFHAVSEKKHEEQDYKPEVIVKTSNKNGLLEIIVKDNGNGIPENIMDKIFQPFFSTKPTGEGTGLGLSMSYDIITKGHGGELNVNSEIGIGTEFIIHLKI